MSSEEFKTGNLALVVYLTLQGFKHRSVEQIDGRGVWCFAAKEDANILEWIGEFEGGSARVEPVEFMRAQREIREELYRFVGKRYAA